jgi:hypothetical protein
MFRGNASGSGAPLPVSTIPSVQLVSHEQYTHNNARLEQLQEVLDNWKRSNEMGHDQWVRMQNEVMQIIEAGEQAKSVWRVVCGIQVLITRFFFLIGECWQSCSLGENKHSLVGQSSLTFLPQTAQ